MVAHVLVRPPSPRLAEGELTHLERQPVDPDLALRQWQGYVAALSAAGFDPITLPAAPEHPDGVFVEDTVVMFGRTALATRPGAASRAGEVASTVATLTELGTVIHQIEAPGTLEGGDVLKIDRTVYVGLSSRTNAEGARQLAAVAEPAGYQIVTVPVTRTLHLKSQVTALPDGTVIGYLPLVDSPESFSPFLPVPEPEGTAVVVLDDSTVLMSAAAPRTATLLQDRGLRVITAAISEFEKLEGCVTCLSVRMR